MHRYSIFTVFFLLFFVFANYPASAQGFPWQDFKARTLNEIVAMEKDVEQKNYDKPNVVLHADKLLSKVRVVYKGDFRKISDTKLEYLKQWVTMFSGSGENYVKLFESEFLFTEGKDEYWLPVQKQVSAYFDKELKKGDEIDIYLVRAGGVYFKKKWDWLFLIEEFQKPKAKTNET
jgi:molybdopterin converting factor small subunit